MYKPRYFINYPTTERREIFSGLARITALYKLYYKYTSTIIIIIDYTYSHKIISI